MENPHIVEFSEYCNTCEYIAIPGTEDPCDECLGCSVRESSRKPINYKKAKE